MDWQKTQYSGDTIGLTETNSGAASNISPRLLTIQSPTK